MSPAVQKESRKHGREKGRDGRKGSERERGKVRGAEEEAALSDGGTAASSTLLSAHGCVSLAQTEIGLKCFIMAGLC